MISVDEALSRILESLSPLPSEVVAVSDAMLRVLAGDVSARRNQPPCDVSAMDGYAVRSEDVATVPATLQVIGEAPAGGAHIGVVGPGQAVRIFTGGPLPQGADAIVIQEDVATPSETHIVVNETSVSGRYIRPQGLDFSYGETLLRAGHLLTSRDLSLAAAMGVTWLRLTRRPRVAVLATGDELVMPGDPVGQQDIISSTPVGLAAAITAWGGDPVFLGIARDQEKELRDLASGADGTDLMITLGGASVGEHDLIQSALGADGLELDFWKIAMRPGKPLIFGRFRKQPLLGFPGNPVSAFVCATLFLKPALRVLSGMTQETAVPVTRRATLARDIPANGKRQDYARAKLGRGKNGELLVEPFEAQDSSMLATLAQADALLVSPPMSPARLAGERVEILLLNDA